MKISKEQGNKELSIKWNETILEVAEQYSCLDVIITNDGKIDTETNNGIKKVNQM
jgi:hypothetical protein